MHLMEVKSSRTSPKLLFVHVDRSFAWLRLWLGGLHHFWAKNFERRCCIAQIHHQQAKPLKVVELAQREVESFRRELRRTQSTLEPNIRNKSGETEIFAKVVRPSHYHCRCY